MGFALSGFAESFPENKRQTAGVFRMLAILTWVSVAATIFLAPEFVVVGQ
jgi:hypothetical protein